jgi:hypothetical protein
MADDSCKEFVPDPLGALPDVRDILFVAAVYDRRHLPALTERRYSTSHRPAGT